MTTRAVPSVLPLSKTKWVVSAMPQHDLGVTHQDPRLILIDGLKREKFEGRIAVSTHRANEAEALKAAGADLVFLPFQDAADRAVSRMRDDRE